MGILTRHVVVELLKVFCLVLTAMTAMLMIFGITKEAVDQGLGFNQVARILPYFLPEALKITIPGTILFAACSVYGRMAASNEVVALKSLGISPKVIMIPGLVLGFIVSLGTVWINDIAVSWGLNGIQRVVIEAAEEIAYGMLKREGSYSTRSLSIVVQDVQGRRLIQPIVTFQANDKSPAVTILAEWAELHSNLDGGQKSFAKPISEATGHKTFHPNPEAEPKSLQILLHNGQVSADGKITYVFSDTQPFEIALNDFSKEKEKSGHPAQLPLNRIPDRIAEQERLIELFEHERASKAAFQMLTGDFAGLASPSWKVDHEYRSYLRGELARLKTEPHRRVSNGFSCICFVLVGMTLSIRWAHGELLSNFFACFLPVLGVYYPLLLFGVNNAKEGTLPPYIVWSGNLLFLGIGAWLWRRVVRY